MQGKKLFLLITLIVFVFGVALFAHADPISVGSRSYDSTAFADSVTSGAEGIIGWNLNSGYSINNGSYVDIDVSFNDNDIINGTGADLTIFEGGGFESFIVTIGGIQRGYNSPTINNYTSSSSGGQVNILDIDLTSFGIAPNSSINSMSIRLWDLGYWGSADILAIAGINSVAVVKDSVGENLQMDSIYSFSLDYNTVETVSVELINRSDEQQSADIELINPYTELSVSVSEPNPFIIESGESLDILFEIDAGLMSPGVYDDLLLKITSANGEILYSTIKIAILNPGVESLPDIEVNSGDIELTDYNLGESATLQAVIKNNGAASASNVTVQFYELDTMLGEAVLEEISAGGVGIASFSFPINESEGDHLVHVVVDPTNSIVELDETNNEASKIVTWGTPSVNNGNILVTGNSPSTVYAGDLFTVSGKAVYDVYVDGTRYTNYAVKGGSVQITIKDDAGNEWIYGGIHTDTNGNFNKYLQAPLTLDNYQLSMTVTDKTFSGTRELVFDVVEEPDTPQEPSAPLTITGTGYWTYVPGSGTETGTWTWTWTTTPVNEPVTQTDLRVFSENIYFSNDNPDPEEDITIFVEINYWATSTDIMAENIPINLYATYPGSDKEKIGSTVISSLSAGGPDFGSQYIYGTWKNQGQGIYIIEVEIDPSFTEENILNNAATRAVIVGDLESNQGMIQGQVTNAWGGVEEVTVELYDENGTTLISSTLTASIGHYYFESLPIGNYQVHIVTPDGYETETDTSSAEVLDQEITVVDFYLTKVEVPVADAAGPYSGEVGDAIILDAGASYDPDGEIVIYEWDLDNDGEYEASASDPELS